MRTSCVVVLFMLLPRWAWADPPVTTPVALTPIPAGPDVIVAVVKGQPAPHDGQLFDQSTSVRWANYLQQCHTRLRLDVAYQYRLDQAEVALTRAELNLERQHNLAVTEDLRKQLSDTQQEAASPSFYRTVWFGVVVGVVTTVVVVAGTAALMNAAK